MSRLKNYQKVVNHFDYQHNNPPAPFNPAYRTYAKEVSREVVAELESEGWYDNYTLAERQTNNLYSKRYNEKMAQREASRRPAML